MLADARQQLSEKNYDSARATILDLRKQHPTALQTRRAAILTLDSVELMETRDSIARYERRLHAEQKAFEQMLPRQNGQTNEA
jgi:predicted Zn-dependent protease